MSGSLERNGRVSGPAGRVAAATRAVAAALEDLATQLESQADISILEPAASAHDLEALVEENRQLRDALGSRATIERAKGVLMARHACSEQDAFKILADAARRQHCKVRRVAEEFLLGLAADTVLADSGVPTGLLG